MRHSDALNPEVFSDEETRLRTLKNTLERRKQTDSIQVREQRSLLLLASKDEQDASADHASLAEKCKQVRITQKRIQRLLANPYFGRIDTQNKHDEAESFCLCREYVPELLVEPLPFYLLEFKDDSGHPFNKKLVDAWGSNDVSPFSVSGEDYEINLVREITITDGILQDVHQRYPILKGESADAFLSEILKKRRAVGNLSDIIETIQKKQFEIIRQPANASFCVQGCAGSGKTQILFTRLFYLRDHFRRNDWHDVLILAPGKLFQQYAREMLDTLHLIDVPQMSVCEYYLQILNQYDDRFKSRQYDFVFSEEHLPDKYLSTIYAPQTVRQIEDAVVRATQNRIEAARAQVGSALDSHSSPIKQARYFRDRLKELINQRELAAQRLDTDAAYKEHLSFVEQAQKQLARDEKRLEQMQLSMRRLTQQLDDFCIHWKASKDAQTNYIAALNKAKEQAACAMETDLLNDSAFYNAFRVWNSVNEALDRLSRGKCICLFGVDDALTKLSGQVVQTTTELLGFCDGDRPIEWRRKTLGRIQQASASVEELRTSMQAKHAQIEQARKWITEYTQSVGIELSDTARDAKRGELERLRYALAYIESGIFEREIWQILESVRVAYNVPTTRERSGSGEKTETVRLLYKADLLFYLYLYHYLYGIPDNLSSYRLICVDEGQDLHEADYRLLSALNPKAALNVFGDIDQRLHGQCGLSDWHDAHIRDNVIFPLDVNYRNPKEIVDFCNREFCCSMQGVGLSGIQVQRFLLTQKEALAHWLDGADEQSAVIVRDRILFEALQKCLGSSGRSLVFLDASAEKVLSDGIHVYTVYAAKGLEFSRVMVVASGMDRNQQLVACTRAMQELIYCE